MDIAQMYNQSASLQDAFNVKANEVTDANEKQKWEQLFNEQKAISDRLRPIQNGENPNPNPNV